MTKDRLAAFTDAVVAIIMTILVLEIKRPEVATLEALWDLRASFAAYALSFWWLGSFWISHHNMWHDAEWVDGRVIWWSMLLLFCLSFVPYATSFVSSHFNSAVAQGFYGVVVVASTASNIGTNKALGEANADLPGFKTMCDKYCRVLSTECTIKVVALLVAIAFWPPAVMCGVVIAAVVIYSMRSRWES